eukprot:scaffold22413_cov62-Phaeocystis_antarctica.AAC.2
MYNVKFRSYSMPRRAVVVLHLRGSRTYNMSAALSVASVKLIANWPRESWRHRRGRILASGTYVACEVDHPPIADAPGVPRGRARLAGQGRRAHRAAAPGATQA